MGILNNLKIREKLLLLLSLLLLPLLYFAAVTFLRELEESQKLREEAVQMEESEKVSTLIHAFQKERARMLAASGGERGYRSEAKSHRGETDAAVRELNTFLETAGRPFPDMALLSSLKEHRSRLDQNRLDIQGFMDYSNTVVSTMLNRLDANATGFSDVEVGRELVSFRNLAGAKIQLSRIRSQLMQVMQRSSLSYQDYALLNSQITSYDRALEDFRRYASPASVEDVKQVVSSDNYRRVAALLEAIVSDPGLPLDSLNSEATFRTFTQSIEDLRVSENALIERIGARVAMEIKGREQYMGILAVAIVLVLVFTGVLSYYIVSRISSSLITLKLAADRIRQGATDVHINIHSKDEIGSVAESFRGVLDKSVMLSRVAQAIGEGHYEVEVPVQSSEDVLSHAILDMKDNLQAYTTENANRNWVLTGVSELNGLISGETVMDKVAGNAISFLCEYTGSEAGVLYLHSEDNLLEPAAAYGVAMRREQLPVFEVGTGKVGQAARERKVTVLDSVPEEYLRIKSGLAEVQPASVIIIPLYFANTLLGALELVARQSYTAVQRRLLDDAAERIAVMMHTLKTHLQTQELLYETQNQAEELETQQEELRQLNAELKASEEELRVNQEELQEKNAELEEKAQLLEEQYEALGVQNKALQDAREAIELKMQQVETVSKYKSDFLANMSHELRTPLNSILILSRLLADNVENTLSTKQTDHAQIIHKSGNDLLKLINEILDLSKIESGMVKLEMEEIMLSGISMNAMFSEVAGKKQIRFMEQINPGNSETMVTDRFRLEQILRNFIGNAIKFTEPGGEVEFAVTPVLHRPKFSSEQLREHNDILAFSVRDTGIGIPKEKQGMVFEAFQQADTSTTRKYGGTGLGLTISKELATLLGGEVLLESEPGKGSTFTLYLPRVPQLKGEKLHKVAAAAVPAGTPAPTMATATAPDKGKGAGQVFLHMERQDKQDIKVLIVEDDKGFSDILADFAVAKNFKVFQAASGREGLRLAREEEPDAMLLDIQLPDMSGWDVLRQVREDKALRHINVHVMSAYDKEVIGEFAENEEYLPKPVTLEMLNKAFGSIVGASGASIENILIVEDNEVENMAVGELLRAHGLTSTAAYSAEEAERILGKQKVDCIILDLGLPGMKGYDWMKKIKSQNGLADIPIIIYSGKDLREEEEARLKEFANTIIIKNEYSYLRLLDEVQLFLHRVNQKLPQGSDFKMKLHVPEEVLRGKKVLVVDDDVRNIYSLSSLLELHGMQVEVAYDGQEALQKLEGTTGIDLVLMDVMMPVMDGIEAIKRVRADLRLKHLPIIALTAKAMKEDREKCIEAGASDYIPKPVDTDKLLTLMRVWLYEA